MSVISTPRRVALEPKRTTRAPRKRASTARVARRVANRRSSITIPVLLFGLAVLTIGALILANARQMQIGAMQIGAMQISVMQIGAHRQDGACVG